MARFTVSIEDELKEQLDLYAEENGYNRSEALEMILKGHFSAAPESEPDPAERTEHEASQISPAVFAHLKALHTYLLDLHSVVCKNSEKICLLEESASYKIPDTMPLDPQWMAEHFPGVTMETPSISAEDYYRGEG